MLVAVDADELGARAALGGLARRRLFPHLYGALPLAAVLLGQSRCRSVPDGRHVFPELAP